MIDEITFELTNYCPYSCKYCSSDTVLCRDDAVWLTIDRIRQLLNGNRYNYIILSGGEPLAHPQFYDILLLCQQHSDDVVVYSNAIRHLAYNAGVIDGVYLELAVTPSPDVQKVRVLKRINQGRERVRPEVTLSRNYTDDCESCDHHVVRPSGELTKGPCAKDVAL